MNGPITRYIDTMAYEIHLTKYVNPFLICQQYEGDHGVAEYHIKTEKYQQGPSD